MDTTKPRLYGFVDGDNSTVAVFYEKGVLVNVMISDQMDRVIWDGIKHKIELFESDLDKSLFKNVPCEIKVG